MTSEDRLPGQPEKRRKPVIVETTPQGLAWRRPLIGGAALVCLAVGAYQSMQAEQAMMGRAVFLRAGIALAMLWLAWPTLQRPLRWLPPGLLLVALGILGIVIAQPRTLPALLPLVGIVSTVVVVVTWFRRFW